MSKRYYIETTAAGRQQFVTLKRSHSHGHHHHRHHHHDQTYYKISHEEWKNLLEREHALEESNRALAAENNALRSSLSSSEAETHRLSHVIVPQLQNQIIALEAENKSLRRSVENAGDRSIKHHHELERLNFKIAKLEAENKEVKDENDDLRARVRALSKQLDHGFNRRIADLTKEITYWRDQLHSLKHRLNDLWHQHEKALDCLEQQKKKVVVYEEIIRRRHHGP